MRKSKKKIINISIDSINYDLVFTQIVHKVGNTVMELYYDNHNRLLDVNYNLVGIYRPTKLYLFNNKDIKSYNKKTFRITDDIN